jgi:hypothetical protein
MSTLVDQAERDRFIREHGKNISVIAPAGVGKTTSIVERILHIAQMPEAQAIDRLSRLVVVTYSVRAAQQMQQKARAAMRERGVPTRIRRALQQTFFRRRWRCSGPTRNYGTAFSCAASGGKSSRTGICGTSFTFIRRINSTRWARTFRLVMNSTCRRRPNRSCSACSITGTTRSTPPR